MKSTTMTFLVILPRYVNNCNQGHRPRRELGPTMLMGSVVCNNFFHISQCIQNHLTNIVHQLITLVHKIQWFQNIGKSFGFENWLWNSWSHRGCKHEINQCVPFICKWPASNVNDANVAAQRWETFTMINSSHWHNKKCVCTGQASFDKLTVLNLNRIGVINPSSITADGQVGEPKCEVLLNLSEIACCDCLCTMQKLVVCGHRIKQCSALIATWCSWDANSIVPIHMHQVLFMTRQLIWDCQTRTCIIICAFFAFKWCHNTFCQIQNVQFHTLTLMKSQTMTCTWALGQLWKFNLIVFVHWTDSLTVHFQTWIQR